MLPVAADKVVYKHCCVNLLNVLNASFLLGRCLEWPNFLPNQRRGHWVHCCHWAEAPPTSHVAAVGCCCGKEYLLINVLFYPPAAAYSVGRTSEYCIKVHPSICGAWQAIGCHNLYRIANFSWNSSKRTGKDVLQSQHKQELLLQQ